MFRRRVSESMRGMLGLMPPVLALALALAALLWGLPSSAPATADLASDLAQARWLGSGWCSRGGKR